MHGAAVGKHDNVLLFSDTWQSGFFVIDLCSSLLTFSAVFRVPSSGLHEWISLRLHPVLCNVLCVMYVLKMNGG